QLRLYTGRDEVRRGITNHFSAPCRTRTYNPLIKSQSKAEPNLLPINDYGQSQERFARPFASDNPPDPALARLVESWPALPDHVKAAVLALLSVATNKRDK